MTRKINIVACIMLGLMIGTTLIIFLPIFYHPHSSEEGEPSIAPTSLIVSFATLSSSAIPIIFDCLLDGWNQYSGDIYTHNYQWHYRLLTIVFLLLPLVACIYADDKDWLRINVACYASHRFVSIGVVIYHMYHQVPTYWTLSRTLPVLMSIVAAISFYVGWTVTESDVLFGLQIGSCVISYLAATFLIILSVYSVKSDHYKDAGILFIYILCALINGILLTALRYTLTNSLSSKPDAENGVLLVMLVGNYIALALNAVPAILPGRIARGVARDEKRTNVARQSFVRYISHEIRTPLNVSTVGVAILEDALRMMGNVDPDTVQVVNQTKQALSLATETLNDLLVYEKLTSNLMNLERTLEEPVAFIISTVSLFEFHALEKKIKLVMPVVDNQSSKFKNGFVFIDTYKMSQVLRNLVSNALKFTPSGGSVVVAVDIVESPDDRTYNENEIKVRNLVSSKQRIAGAREWLQISVTDTGAGISAENIKKVFKEIIQFDANKLQQGNGSGLGLFISDGIVKLHNGFISVGSEGLGKGCRFTIELPFVHVDVDMIRDNNIDIHSHKGPDPAALESADGQPTRPRSPSGFDVEDALPGVTLVQYKSFDWSVESPAPPSRSLRATFSGISSQEAGEGGTCGSRILRQKSSMLSIMQSVNSVLSRYSSNSREHHNAEDSEYVKADLITALTKLVDGRTGSSETTQFSTLDLRDKRILVVDDSQVSLKMISLMIKKFGAECIEASNGAVACDIVRQHLQGTQTVDMIIMDNNMAVMNGPQACRCMRNMGYVSPIFGLTGDVDSLREQEFLDAGATFIFQKPLKISDFIAQLTNYSK